MEHDKTTDAMPQEGNEQTRLIERPDGYYWQSQPTGKLYGPFPTLAEAMDDTQYQEVEDYEAAPSLNEVEAELGLDDWIDPDTGGLAEDSAPRLSDE